MTKINWVTKAGVLFLLWAGTAVVLHAQTFTTLYRFCPEGGGCTDGDGPVGAMVQGASGNFYGTTVNGSVSNGTVFKISPGGTLTTLAGFDVTNGSAPYAGLVQAIDGNFYGTTSETEPPNDYGTTFKITPSGTLTTLLIFDGTDGGYPDAGLVQAANGDYYGTTQVGGSSGNCTTQYTFGCGTIFRITPGGTFTMLHSFNGTDGQQPLSGLVQASDGNFYGTAYLGGANGAGTVFKITPSGTLTTLHNFCSQTNCADGAILYAGLVQGTDGNFYGATAAGGANDKNNCQEDLIDGCGTLFEITPSGTLTTLYNFCSQGADGNCTDGDSPLGALVQGTDGKLYGTTQAAGTPRTGSDGDDGTAFSPSVGLAPFVETLPASAVVGAVVKILGTDLTGPTSVTFSGTAAAFTADSHSLITATVPVGATTGTVEVVTPSGTLSSNVPFRVLP
jgi:uncharacterized repeat protein (TIGR03803 family)